MEHPALKASVESRIEDVRPTDPMLARMGYNPNQDLKIAKHIVKVYDLLKTADRNRFEKDYAKLANDNAEQKVHYVSHVRNLATDNSSYLVILEWNELSNEKISRNRQTSTT